MGYSAQINKSSVVLPREALPQILHIWKHINSPEFDQLKHGSSTRGSNSVIRYYSWLDEDYHKKVTSVEEVLTALKFNFSITNQGGILIKNFEENLGQEDLFFVAIAHLIPDSKITWVGEDASIWDWEFKGGVMFNSDKPMKNPFLAELNLLENK